MRMNVQEALSIMQLQGVEVTRELIKQTYRKLAQKNHPDKNPHGLKTMQDINMAYDYLSQIPDSSLSNRNEKTKPQPEPEKPKEPKIYQYLRMVGLFVYKNEWSTKVWVEGKTFDHKEFLKQYGFRWCPDRKAWWRYDY